MKILALVPARGGSKRLPGKNTRVLGGRPLIAWSIQVAQGLPDVVEVLVSTDCSHIADVGRNEGALVPWLRPAHLATDEASSADVALHALDYYIRDHGDVDGLMLLQPTSPFRSRETLIRGLEMFRTNGARSIVGLSPASAHPSWCYRIDADSMSSFIESSGSRVSSQDLQPAYVLNGAFYLISPRELRANHSFQSQSTMPLVMNDPAEGVDIDTEMDWLWAELLLERVLSRPPE